MSAPAHMSWSQASEYARCSKAFELRRIQGAPSVPTSWLYGGSLVHKAIEMVNLATFKGEKFDLDKLWTEAIEFTDADQEARTPGITDDDYRKPFRGGWDVPAWRANGVVHVEAWLGFLDSTDWRIADHEGEPLVEIDLTCEYGWGEEMYEIKGSADVVMLQPSGKKVLLDIKTGKAPSTFLQLGLYACSMERLGMGKPDLGGFFLTKANALGAIDSMLQFRGEYFDDLFTRTRAGVNAGVFMPCMVPDVCRMCDVSDACYAMRGPMSRSYDPDHPDFDPSV